MNAGSTDFPLNQKIVPLMNFFSLPIKEKAIFIVLIKRTIVIVYVKFIAKNFFMIYHMMTSVNYRHEWARQVLH